jgi:uncharacterized protein (DUF362 family)
MKPKVLIYHCWDYDPMRIAEIISTGMDELGVRPRGRTMVKPNAVLAHPHYFRHAFTRSEFLDGLLAALLERGAEITDLSVGERSGPSVPTRYTFAEAGYGPVLRRYRARAIYFDEAPQVEVPLTRPEALRQAVLIPEPLMRCDFLVNAPKLKAHPWTMFTAALANYTGLQDDAPRLLDHQRLHHKIADLQDVIAPGLVIVDAIVAGQDTMMTPAPRHLNLIILGINPVAVDVVCAHLLGLDPAQVDYLRLCAERGLGPLDIADIELGGDLTLAEAQQRAIGFRLALHRADKLFDRGARIRAFSGPPGDPAIGAYCWSGCPGTLYEATEIVRQFQPGVYQQVRPIHFVFGNYTGSLPETKDAPLVLVGDCAQFCGKVNGSQVDVASVYRPRTDTSQHLRPRPNLLRDIARVLRALWRGRGQPAVILRGCPVGVSEMALMLAFLGRVKNPYFSPNIAPKFMFYYLVSKVIRAVRGIR